MRDEFRYSPVRNMGLRRQSSAEFDASGAKAWDGPAITDEEAAALARTTVDLFRHWQIDDTEACALLGGIAKSAWARWKEGMIDHPALIDDDRRWRMALLINIQVGLRNLFDEPEHGYAWIRKPIKSLDGKTPLDIMSKGQFADLIRIRKWVYAACRTW